MTAKIQQQVVKRHSQASGSVHGITRKQWNNNSIFSRRAPGISAQSGSAQHSTVTLAFALSSLVVVALLGMFYLQQVFGTAERGTDLQALETEIMDMKQQQKELELEGARLRSIQTVEENVNKLNLVASEEVAYLAPDAGKVAMNVE
jgi:hypothetical protein